MITYKFAYNLQQNIIDIQTLSKENKAGVFTCLGCEDELIPVLGKKNEHHFRHKVITENSCSIETYLHRLAKIKFYETYDKCLKEHKPFFIKMETYLVCDFYENEFLKVCELAPKISQFELTQSFKKIYLERKENSFIPDVLLEDTDNQRKIFFEVFVSSPCSQKKIESNYMIIEFKLDSKKGIRNSEKDIDEIESCLLEQSEKVKFINFYNKLKDNYCNGQCFNEIIIPYSSNELLYNIFVVFKSGESDFINNLQIKQIDSLQSKILHLEYISVVEPIDEINFIKNRKFTRQKEDLTDRNCFLCVHHRPNKFSDREGTIFCQPLNKTGNSNMGIKCLRFRADPHSFSKYKYIEYRDIQEYENSQEYDNIQEDNEKWF